MQFMEEESEDEPTAAVITPVVVRQQAEAFEQVQEAVALLVAKLASKEV